MSLRTVPLIALLLLAACQPSPPALQTATALPEPRALPVFTLRDELDQPFTQREFAGQWSLVFFGYSHCPDICSPTLARLAAALKRLPEALRSSARVVFVSLDPARDTPAVLAGFVRRIHPDIVGLSGEPGQIEVLAGALAIHHQTRNAAGGGQVDHSGAALVVDDRGRFAAVISAPGDPAMIAHDLAALMEAGS